MSDYLFNEFFFVFNNLCAHCFQLREKTTQNISFSVFQIYFFLCGLFRGPILLHFFFEAKYHWYQHADESKSILQNKLTFQFIEKIQFLTLNRGKTTKRNMHCLNFKQFYAHILARCCIWFCFNDINGNGFFSAHSFSHSSTPLLLLRFCIFVCVFLSVISFS